MKKVIIDIDGVLNDYPYTQLLFYEKEYSRGDTVKTLSELKKKLSYNDYKDLKEKYRLSDYKHKCKPKEYACELLKYLKDNGYLIYIMTSRELFRLNQLEKTICWLRDNNLHYDYLYCTQKKDFTMFEKFKNIDVVIEDNCDNTNRIKKIINNDCLYFIVNNNDNLNKHTDEGIVRVNKLNEIVNFLENVKKTIYFS